MVFRILEEGRPLDEVVFYNTGMEFDSIYRNRDRVRKILAEILPCQIPYSVRAKVLAPAATQTEFGKKANNVDAYDYDKAFGTYHTSRQMAEFLLKLYDSDSTLGIVDRETFQFKLQPPVFPYANSSTHNQNPN